MSCTSSDTPSNAWCAPKRFERLEMLSLKTQPAFQSPCPKRYRQRQNQIACGQWQICLQRAVRGGVHITCRLRKFVHRDDRQQRRILDQRNELADERWQDYTQGLRNNYVTICLACGQPNGSRRFQL